MHWGRAKRQSDRRTEEIEQPPSRIATAVIVTGSLICTLFVAVAIASDREIADYPYQKSVAAVQAWRREHTALAAALGIDAYLGEEAVYTAAFPGEETRWTFSDYMRDAFRSFLFGEES